MLVHVVYACGVRVCVTATLFDAVCALQHTVYTLVLRDAGVHGPVGRQPPRQGCHHCVTIATAGAPTWADACSPAWTSL